MTSSLKSTNKEINFVDERTLDAQLTSFVQVRELHKYTEDQLTKSAENFDAKLSNYVKNEELNNKIIELLKEKRAAWRFWFPVILSTVISLVVAYFNSRK